jgi:hypothetical protein
MKNEVGFIKSKLQPDYYKNIFGGWTAVFLINDKEYHLSLNIDYSTKKIKDFSILIQMAENRIEKSVHKSFKNAYEALLKLIKE